MIQIQPTAQTRRTHFPNSGLALNVGSLAPVQREASIRVDGLSVMPNTQSPQKAKRAVVRRSWQRPNYSLASAIAFGVGFMAISALTLEA